MTATDPAASLRRSIYLLLTTVSVAVACAKVVGAENVWEPSRYRPPTPSSYGADRPDPPARGWPDARPEPTPMFGSNDRSRWATIRALVEEGTYAVGRRENHTAATDYRDTGLIFEDGWQSIDKVMDPATGLYYSSKPPLMPTVLAGEYWVLNRAFGLSITRDRWWVVGIILITVNVLPLAVYLIFLARLIEDHGTTDFGRVFVFATACLGTFLTTFSVTLNNHSPAVCATLFAVYPLLRKRAGAVGESAGGLFTNGFFAGLLVTLELPAAGLLAALFVPLFVARPKSTLLFFLPGAIVPLAGLLATNYLAIGEVLPAYDKFDTPWYRYPGSHWSKAGAAARGIDFAHEPKSVYAFHVLFGHHGWFSLTPVWLLGIGGLVGLTMSIAPDVKRLFGRKAAEPVWTLPLFGAMALSVSAVVIAFYIWKTNNYGGNTSGARWLFWLTPLWLIGTLPAADRVGRIAFGRAVCAVLLGVSVLSVFYPAWNPWRPPWVQQLLEVNGVVQY